MVDSVRFSFTQMNRELGAFSALPYLPLTLTYQNCSLQVSGLLDTGASVNVLPYEIGLGLGAIWERQTLAVPLGGNLAKFEARALVLRANVDRFALCRISFCLDKGQKCSFNSGADEFFSSIRCVLLSG